MTNTEQTFERVDLVLGAVPMVFVGGRTKGFEPHCIALHNVKYFYEPDSSRHVLIGDNGGVRKTIEIYGNLVLMRGQEAQQ